MKTIEVVAAIIEHEGRILATQRGYGDFKDGWEFPGGKMEPGETPEAAIVREIEEELKVTIAPKTLVTTVASSERSLSLLITWSRTHNSASMTVLPVVLQHLKISHLDVHRSLVHHLLRVY